MAFTAGVNVYGVFRAVVSGYKFVTFYLHQWQESSEVAASTVVSEVEASTSEDACTQMQAKRQEFVTWDHGPEDTIYIPTFHHIYFTTYGNIPVGHLPLLATQKDLMKKTE